jgi:hypothetical protein
MPTHPTILDYYAGVSACVVLRGPRSYSGGRLLGEMCRAKVGRLPFFLMTCERRASAVAPPSDKDEEPHAYGRELEALFEALGL